MTTRYLALVLLAVAFSVSTKAQDSLHLFPIVENDKLGFIDVTGQQRIASQFVGYACSVRSLPQFSEGLAPVNVGDRVAYIDQTGKIAFQLSAHHVDPYPFHEGVALLQLRTFLVGVPDDWVWIDRNGKLLHVEATGLPAEFHEGLMKRQTGQYWGYVDHSFQWAIAPQFENAEDFSGGLALVHLKTGRKSDWAFIDRSGGIIFKSEDRYLEASSFSNGLARVSRLPLSGPLAHQEFIGFLDDKGMKPSPQYSAGPLSGSQTAVHSPA